MNSQQWAADEAVIEVEHFNEMVDIWKDEGMDIKKIVEKDFKYWENVFAREIDKEALIAEYARVWNEHVVNKEYTI